MDEEHEAVTDDDRDDRIDDVEVEDKEEEEEDTDDPKWHQPLITRTLADAPPETLFSVDALARTLRSPVAAMEGAIKRGELPQPIQIGERRVWTVEAVNAHIEERLRRAADGSAAAEPKQGRRSAPKRRRRG